MIRGSFRKMNTKYKIFICLITVLLIVSSVVTASPYAQAKQQIKTSKSVVSDAHGLHDIIDIAYDGLTTNTVALQEDGTIWYWLGGGKAKQGPTIEGAIQVTGGNLVLKKDGTVWEWDKNTHEVTPVTELNNIVELQSNDGYDSTALALDKNNTLWVKGNSKVALMVLGKALNADTTDSSSQLEKEKVLNFERGLEHIQTMTIAMNGDIGIVKQDGTIEHYYYKYDYPKPEQGKFTYRLPKPLLIKDIHLQVTFDRFNDGYLNSITVVANDGSAWYGAYEKTLKRFYEPKVKLVSTSGSQISRGGFSELYALDLQGNLMGIEMTQDSKERYSNNTIKYSNIKNIKKVISRWQNSALALKKDGTVWEWGPNKDSYQDYLVLTSLEEKIQPTPIEKEISVYWNGQRLPLSSQPVMKKSLMLPMRELFEAFGSEVKYNDGNIVIKQGKKIMQLKIYSHDAILDGKRMKLTEAPIYIDGKTYVPLRFVAQSLGAGVAWDAKEQVANIKYSK